MYERTQAGDIRLDDKCRVESLIVRKLVPEPVCVPGKENHRHLARRGVGAHGLEYLDARHIAQIHIQNHEVGSVLHDTGSRARPNATAHHVEAHSADIVTQAFDNVRVVVHDDDG